jgi:hypothetical protein
VSDSAKIRQSIWRLPPKPDCTPEMAAAGQVWVWIWDQTQLAPELDDPWTYNIEPILEGRWEVRGTGVK